MLGKESSIADGNSQRIFRLSVKGSMLCFLGLVALSIIPRQKNVNVTTGFKKGSA
jgi:hypothetical protein